MDNAYWELLEAIGTERLDVDFKVDQLYQYYLKDRSTVPPDIRQIFDAIPRRNRIPKPEYDEAFRFFSDDESNI